MLQRYNYLKMKHFISCGLLIALMSAGAFVSCLTKNVFDETDDDSMRITYFAFEKLSPAVEGVIDDVKKEITAIVPFGTDLTNLKPVIRCSKGAEAVLSGNSSFLLPASVTLTGNGVSVLYTVYVREALTEAVTLKVGKDKPFKTIREAAGAAGDNTVIEIDAGTYKGDVIDWRQNNVHIRAVGGDVVVDADGKSTGGGVGTWQMVGGRICVEGITFVNAKVQDKNGAGIRLTQGDLTVINCRFMYNECGILTANSGTIRLTVRNCEFGYNGIVNNDGYVHSLYAGLISRLIVTGCYFHHVRTGHLLKSRAALNVISYNMIADGKEADSRASYEIDIPSGGQAILVGNIIQKSSTPSNPHLVSFAMEHTDRYPKNEIYMSHNTFINYHNAAGDRVLNAPASVTKKAYNNLISENTRFDPARPLTDEDGNVSFKENELTGNYAPSTAVRENWAKLLAPDIDRNLPADLKSMGLSLVPACEYRHPMRVAALTGTVAVSGAIQTPAQ
jgi:hypothetical protein